MPLHKTIVWILLIPFLLFSCEQKITIKETKLTGINPLSFTDVVFKSKRDTVLVASFDGKITEVVNQGSHIDKRLIFNLKDEIYSLAYDVADHLIYASTLNQGIVVINEQKKQIERVLPLQNKWIPEIEFNAELNILAGNDNNLKARVWDLDKSSMVLPNELANMRLGTISKDGTIYFDGNGVARIWDIQENTVSEEFEVPGTISDANNEGEVLGMIYNEFLLKDIRKDRLLLIRKHPDWPIYVKSQDTTVRVPVSLPLTDAVLSEKAIYTSGIDRSVRKWDKKNGELLDTFLGHKATVSALAISGNETQLASVDLKGGIKFWDLN